MSIWVSFDILLGLGELCLLALFPFGIAPLGLLPGPSLGGCQFLVVLLIWLLLVLVLCGRSLLMVFVRRFTGLVVLVRDGKDFDLTENPLHTSRVSEFNLGHVYGRDCIMRGIPVCLFLITRGGVVIRMMWGMFLLRSGLGWDSSLGLCLPTSPGLHVL